ncbi:MAG: AAA family ATPase [Methylococcales bacterium]
MLTIADFLPENLRVDAPACAGRPNLVHLFDEKHCLALWAAYAAGRPLLVRGEPGTGKSQLARAIAAHLNWVFVSEVIQGGTEISDLQWHYDAVGRLGAAQAQASSLLTQSGQSESESINRDEPEPTCFPERKPDMNPLDYLSPGVFWWAFNWDEASSQYTRSRVRARPKPIEPRGWDSNKNGVVVLIDEIDKADPDLPNGLLETLNGYQFTVPYLQHPVSAKDPSRILVVVTTNEERELPWAFLRRCFVLRLEMEKSQDKRIEWLAQRGRAHFRAELHEELPLRAAELLWKDRDKAEQDNALFKPGLAEYLDLLRALARIDKNQQVNTLERICEFVLVKSTDEP